VAAKRRAGRAGKHAREARHILIVDDEESLTFFLREGLLEVDANWLVDTASTGEEAVIKINRYAYRLIISDLRMPGLNGLELLQMVRALEPETRIMLMTAYGSAQVAEEARRLGVFRYVPKPFKIEDMKEWVQEALVTLPEVSVVAKPEVTALPAEPVREEEPLAMVPPVVEGPSEMPANVREQVAAYLGQLRFRIGARYAYVGDLGGRLLADAGAAKGLNVTEFASLVANSLHSAQAAGSPLGQGGASLLLQRMAAYDLYASTVGRDWLLALLYERKTPSRRREAILSALEKAAAELGTILAKAPAVGDSHPAVGPASDGFADKAPSPDRGGSIGPGQGSGSALNENAPAGAMQAPRNSDVLTFEEAQAMGLIDEDLLSRLAGDAK